MATATPLRRNRAFTLLWSGQAVSALGTRITSVALPLLVLAETHSPTKAGIAGFAQTLPFLVFQLPAGAYADRLDRRRIMLAADAARAFAVGSIPVALALGRLAFAQIVAVALVEGTGFVWFYLAENAALPHIVTREQLSTALARNQARSEGAALIGQPLGGVLFGVGRAVPFLADACSYAISFLTLLFVRGAFQSAPAREPTPVRRDIAEGGRFVLAQPFLRAAIVIVSAANFLFSALVLALIVRAKDLGASPSLIGAMFAFAGGSGIAGSLAAPWITRNVAARAVVLGALWTWAAAAAGCAAARGPLALGALYGAAFLVSPAFNVVLAGYRYALVPDRLLARVQSVNLTVGWGAIPLGSLGAGFALAAAGSRATLLAIAAGAAMLALAATAARVIRTAPQPEELERARFHRRTQG